MCTLTGPQGGIPNDKAEVQNGTAILQASQIPNTTDAVHEYETLGGKLTAYSNYGVDILKDRPDLIQERERLFTVRYPNFGIFFYTVVNGNDVLFRNGLLYLIRINNVLAKQL